MTYKFRVTGNHSITPRDRKKSVSPGKRGTTDDEEWFRWARYVQRSIKPIEDKPKVEKIEDIDRMDD